MSFTWIDDENDAELLAAWGALRAKVGERAGWQYRGSRFEANQWQHGFLNKQLRDAAESAEDMDEAAYSIPASAGWWPGEAAGAPGTLPTGMPRHLKAVLVSIPQQPQRQDSTNAQLQDLRAFAIRLGLYDADDVLRTLLDRK